MLGSLFSSFVLVALAISPSVTDARRLQRRACNFTWPAIEGDTCATMARDWSKEEQVFKAMNPGVDCANLVVGKEYCVEWEGTLPTPPAITSAPVPSATPSSTTLVKKKSSVPPPSRPVAPSPVQEGVAANCKKWYLVSGGDNCQKIVDTYKTFTLAQFYQWNPAVGSGCGSLWLDYYVCVGIPGTPTRAPSNPTTKAPAAPTADNRPCRWNPSKGQYDCPGVWPAAPGPVQEGVPYNCVKWVLQKSGVFCADMAKSAGISLDLFYSLNPAVGKSCAGLWPGIYIHAGDFCISRGSTVASNDSRSELCSVLVEWGDHAGGPVGGIKSGTRFGLTVCCPPGRIGTYVSALPCAAVPQQLFVGMSLEKIIVPHQDKDSQRQEMNEHPQSNLPRSDH
ncbi:hypothetical protein EJ07DRAFT_153601 [Lizonia empirigonia]|nr:hypothetical protein EJ07DRAFT_153601 [Lizonia empirigonia]